LKNDVNAPSKSNKQENYKPEVWICTQKFHGSATLIRGTDQDPSQFSHKGVERTEIMLAKKIVTQNLSLKQNIKD
jgi:hypothetical protein